MKPISHYWRVCVLILAAGLVAFFSPRTFAQPTNADLQLSFTNSVRGVALGQYFQSTASLYNAGWETATNAVLTNWLPAGLQFVSATSSRGTLNTNGNVLSWALGDFPPYQTATLTLEFKGVAAGSYTNVAMAVSDTPDPNPTNSQATLLAVVTPARFIVVGVPHTFYDVPTVTPLPNGKALVVGSPLTHTADVYNASTRLFELPGPTQSLHSHHTATMMNNGLVLIVGGDYLPWIPELFDPSTSQFTPTVGNTSAPRWYHTATLLNDGRVLLCGNAYPPLTNEAYDPTTGLFSLAPDLQCAPTGTLLPSGKYLTVFATSATLYDPVTGTTTPTGPPLQSRGDHTATLLPGGKVLIAGGRIFNTTERPTASAEIYDIATGTFTPTASLNTARTEHGACVLPDGTALIASGLGGPNGPGLVSAEIFDPNGTFNAPGVGVSDTNIVEGDAGTTNWMQFTIWLTATSALPVTVDFATTAGTAGTVDYGVAGLDFGNTNGTVIFAPGQTNATILVPIFGDNVREPNETLMMNLSNPTQAWMSRAVATGTIIDNDPIPNLTITPAVVTEGDTGLSNLIFNVTLLAQSLTTVTVDYSTSDGTATAGSDYIATSGTLVFNPGDTNKTISLPVIGDLVVEPNETLQMSLANPTNAMIGVAQATGTILNNDGFAGQIHHFDISAIGGAQVQTVGFPVSITAKDIFGNVASGFSGLVELSAATTNVIATNLDFELPTSAPWVTFNDTPYDRPFQQAFYDVEGLGVPSTAYRTFAGGGSNGITQNIYLTGGIPYTFSVNVAQSMEAYDMSCLGAGIYLAIGSTNVGWGTDICGGTIRNTLSLVYTPPTNGMYPLQLVVDRDYYGGDALAVYMDDVQIRYPVITPTVLTNNFTNGVWTGMVTSLQAATNVTLLANDMRGHKGASNPFYVQAATDIGLTVTAQLQDPGPLRPGSRQFLTMSLTNRGPSDAANVVVQTTWPTNVTLLFTSTLSGTFTNFTSGRDWVLPPLPKGSNFTATLAFQADVPGDFTNPFTVISPTLDLNTADNSVAFSNHIEPPLIVISDASGTEANAGATGMVFTATLYGASAQTVSADYYTWNVSAVSGQDYVGTNGTIIFPPGVTNATITVYAIDNILNQPNRYFFLFLTNAVNAAFGDAVGQGTIVDDDPPPTISIADTSVVEGDSGTTNAVFQLSMNKPAIADVTVHCATATNTASANDFVSTSGNVTFPAGSTNATFSVPVNGDTVNEPNETFFVNISGAPNNATIIRAQAVGTIINDDAVPGRLDHFGWDVIGSPRYSTLPFNVTLRALDYAGNPASNGISGATVIARNSFVGELLDDFEDGSSIGWTNFQTSTVTTVVTNETAAQGSNSLRLSGFVSVYLPAGVRHGIPNSRPDRISFSARMEQTNQLVAFNGMRSNQAVTLFAFENNGQMGVFDSQQAFHGLPYQSNHWYQVDMTIDWGVPQANYRIDGVLAMTNVMLVRLPTNFDSLLLEPVGGASTSWWDNVQVFNDDLTNTFAVTPSNFVGFVNGAKTSTIAIDGAGTNVYLYADDGLEHVGSSGFFDLLPVNLTLVTPANMTEGSAPTNARVYLPVAFPGPITVTLTSSAPARITMPASVVILANQTNANFSLGVVDDTIANWTMPVFIAASGTNVVATTNVISVIDNDPAPGALPSGRRADGRFQIVLQGPPATNYVLMASSNLVNWDAISNLSFTNGPVMFIDSLSTNLSHRFYRLAPAP